MARSAAANKNNKVKHGLDIPSHIFFTIICVVLVLFSLLVVGMLFWAFITSLKEDDVIELIFDKVKTEYDNKLKDVPKEISDEFEKAVSLNIIDKYWTENINALAHLREAVMMRGYGGEDPLRAYSMDGVDMYEAMLENIDRDVTHILVKAEVKQNLERKEAVKNKVANDSDTTATTTVNKGKKIGRNDPCPCGSGKKYKQCHGK